MPIGMFGGGVTGGGGSSRGLPGTNLGPHKGVGAYGQVPQAIDTPENIWGQVSRNLPNFGQLTSGTSNVIGSQLQGEVSPMTINALRTAGAQFGVSSGMPGSGLQAHNLYGNIAGFSENQQQRGIGNYLQTLAGVGAAQTDPRLAASIAERNAELAAAPDPEMAAAEMERLYQKHFNQTRGIGGFGGGGGGYSPWAKPATGAGMRQFSTGNPFGFRPNEPAGGSGGSVSNPFGYEQAGNYASLGIGPGGGTPGTGGPAQSGIYGGMFPQQFNQPAPPSWYQNTYGNQTFGGGGYYGPGGGPNFQGSELGPGVSGGSTYTGPYYGQGSPMGRNPQLAGGYFVPGEGD